MWKPKIVELPEPCGCLNKEVVHGVVICVEKCRFHKLESTDPKTLGEDYYQRCLGLNIQQVLLGTSPHVDEMREALGDFPDRPGALALEIGGGCSPYLAQLTRRGYRPTVVEPSDYAAGWCETSFGADRIAGDWLTAAQRVTPGDGRQKYDLILSAHSLEHMEAPVYCIEKMAHWLAPNGLLYLLVPEGTDRTNPDHWAFFTAISLRKSVESTGLAVEVCVVRSIMKHERFIYLRARKQKTNE